MRDSLGSGVCVSHLGVPHRGLADQAGFVQARHAEAEGDRVGTAP